MADLKDLIQDLQRGKKDFQTKKPKAVKQLGEKLREHIKNQTPVDTGRLASSYTLDADNDSAIVGNPVDYTQYVNDGHATGDGFVPGLHMYEKGLLQVETDADKIIEGFFNDLKILG